MDKEELIRKYYQAWVDKDIEKMRNVFSQDCVYIECFGEEYHGEQQILRWFEEWNKNGSILEWRVKSIHHCEDVAVVESFFKCKTKDVFACDAAAVIKFNEKGLICEVREYWSKLERHLPYGE